MNNKIFTFFCALTVLINLSFKAKSANECFEGVSRSVFKFNMAFDNIILEPVAKGYNKLPDPLKKGTSNFTSNIASRSRFWEFLN